MEIDESRLTKIALFIVIGWIAGSPAHAQVGASFGAGRSRFSLSAAYSSFNDRTYTVVGAGAGYYLFEGFEVGLDGDAWMGDKPHIYTVSPGVKYVLNTPSSFKPYLGGFYKRTFYDDFPNKDSAGGRAGFATPISEHVYASAGVVYENMFNCDRALYDRCSMVYPEAGISISY